MESRGETWLKVAMRAEYGLGKGSIVMYIQVCEGVSVRECV